MFLCIKVTKDSSFSKESYIFPVWIQKFDPKSTPKPFLGGYRNKKSGREYHHASSQTPTEALAGMKASFSLLGTKKIKDTSNLRTRETQTSEWKSRSMQTTREFGTQMERIDLRLDPSKKNEIILSPRKYRTAEELLIIKKEKCIVIQRCWRGFWARKRAKDIKIRNREFELEQQRERCVFDYYLKIKIINLFKAREAIFMLLKLPLSTLSPKYFTIFRFH